MPYFCVQKWISALRGSDQQTQPTQKPMIEATTEKNSENTTPYTIELFSTSKRSTTTTTPSDDEENKVDSNL